MKYRGLTYNREKESYEWVYGLPSYGYATDEVAEIGTVYGDFREIFPDTLGEQTPYRDKNGKEIYTGDIVALEVDGQIREFVVDKASTCKVTAVNEKGTHKYHCISQDGKGVYGWVNAESIKELSSKAHSDPASVSKGDIVTFTGGGVYESSTAEYASVQKNVTSTCKVTAVNTKGTHPYHCISQDGKGVYGWVNAADVK